MALLVDEAVEVAVRADDFLFEEDDGTTVDILVAFGVSLPPEGSLTDEVDAFFVEPDVTAGVSLLTDEVAGSFVEPAGVGVAIVLFSSDNALLMNF